MLAQYPKTRKVVYLIFGIVGVIITAAQVGYIAAVNEHVIAAVPWPVPVALAVYAYLGIAIGFTANSNTARTERVTAAE